MQPAILARSPTWQGDTPQVTVIVSTFNRSGFLEGLVDALERQTLDRHRFEVVVLDNGSSDDTATELARLSSTTALRLIAGRLEENHGPAQGRNAAASLARAPLLAITDDDCLPTPGWLEALVRAFDDGADVVQGRTGPPTGVPRPSPWARTISINGFTSLYETCNVGYRRTLFDEAGAFDADDPLVRSQGGRAFGEDALLGWRVESLGGRPAFAPDAVVHHRWLAGTYRGWLRERRQLAGFPAFGRRSTSFRERLWLGVFLNKRTFEVDIAVASVLTAAVSRRPLLVVGALPWVRRRWGDTKYRPGGPRVIRLAQLAVGDVVGLTWLVRGSVRHRRLLL